MRSTCYQEKREGRALAIGDEVRISHAIVQTVAAAGKQMATR